MKITVDKIAALRPKPCEDRFDNFVKHYPDFEGDLQQFIELEKITYSDKVWVVTRLFSKEQNVRWAKLCADSVAHLVESAAAWAAVAAEAAWAAEAAREAAAAWAAVAAEAAVAAGAAREEQKTKNLSFMLMCEDV